MSEPTLEEKLREIALANRCVIKLKFIDQCVTAEFEPDDLNKYYKYELFGSIYDAINWLYETAKREGYLG